MTTIRSANIITGVVVGLANRDREPAVTQTYETLLRWGSNTLVNWGDDTTITWNLAPPTNP